ncbi:MAG: hypothetical protein SFV18_06505 [Bryobacteraceae bacterium]|nr:hypothetical protein [Bryobacteraceae bacterium]
MRTTLNIDEDALEFARAYAESCNLTLGEAVSNLIRPIRPAKYVTLPNGLTIEDVPEDGSLTSEMVTKILNDEYEEMAARYQRVDSATPPRSRSSPRRPALVR